MRGIVWAYITEDANQKLLEIEEDYNRLGIPTHKKVISQSIAPILYLRITICGEL